MNYCLWPGVPLPIFFFYVWSSVFPIESEMKPLEEVRRYTSSFMTHNGWHRYAIQCCCSTFGVQQKRLQWLKCPGKVCEPMKGVNQLSAAATSLTEKVKLWRRVRDLMWKGWDEEKKGLIGQTPGKDPPTDGGAEGCGRRYIPVPPSSPSSLHVLKIFWNE